MARISVLALVCALLILAFTAAQDERQKKYKCAILLPNIRLNRGKTREEMCKRAIFRNVRTWTGGNNDDFPGCENCDCCAEDGWIENIKDAAVDKIKDRLTNQEKYRCAKLFPNLDINGGKTRQEICESKITIKGVEITRTWTGGNNDDFPGCGECDCCAENDLIDQILDQFKEAEIPDEKYRCVRLDTMLENGWKRLPRNRGKTEQEQCEREMWIAGGEVKRTWTGGNNDDFPGCRDCNCCAENGWVRDALNDRFSQDQNEVGAIDPVDLL